MLEKFTDRIYILPYEEGITKPALGLIIGNKESLVIDGGHSEAHAKEFLDHVYKLNIPYPKYLTVTHWHWDHVAGAETMKLINLINNKTQEKLKRVEQTIKSDSEVTVDKLGRTMYNTVENLKSQMDKGLKLLTADIVFKKSVEINLGELSCIIENVGGDHSVDSNIIYVKEEKFMFLGDTIYRDLNEEHRAYHIDVMKPLIENIMKYDTDYYLTAHKPMYTKKEMHDHFESLIDIGEFVGERTDLRQLTVEYGDKQGSKTTAEQRFLIGSFVNGNKN